MKFNAIAVIVTSLLMLLSCCAATGANCSSGPAGGDTTGLHSGGFGDAGPSGDLNDGPAPGNAGTTPCPTALNTILLVDDDHSSSGLPGYMNVTATMAASLGVAYAFDSYTVPAGSNGPGIGKLRNYSLVIWLTGYENGSAGPTLTPDDQQNIATFLEEGNSLWLIGQDVMRELGLNGFVKNYLHVSEYDENGGSDCPVPDPLLGVTGDNVTDGMNYTTSGAYPGNNSDALKPDSMGTGIFGQNQTLMPGYFTALRCNLSYRLVFCALEFSAITSFNNRTELVNKTVSWLSAGRDPALAVYHDSEALSGPGLTPKYNFTVRNLGNHSDTFDFKVVSKWTVALRNATSGAPVTDTDTDGKPDTGALPPGYRGNFSAEVQVPLSAVNKESCFTTIMANSSRTAGVSDSVFFETTVYAKSNRHRAVYIPYLIESNGTNNLTAPYDDMLLYNSARWCSNSAGNIYFGVLRSWATANKNSSTIRDWDLRHADINVTYIESSNITYGELVSSWADVVFISNASKAPWEFNSYEVAAIKQYVQDGHGIIATFGTLASAGVPNNAGLSQLFDINATQSADWRTPFYDVRVGNRNHPVSAGLPNDWFIPGSFTLGAARGIKPAQNASKPIALEGFPEDTHVIAYDSYRAAHDIAIENIQVPEWLKLGEKLTAKATLRNLGTSGESNIVVSLKVNGTLETSTLIPAFASGAQKQLSFDYTPKGTAKYLIELEAAKVPLEPDNYTWNNRLSQNLVVLVQAGRISAMVLRSPAVVENYKSLWYWNDLSAHWYRYANLSRAYSVEINTTFLAGAISKGRLNSSAADVLIAPFADPNYDGNSSFEYSDAEISAIKGYIRDGRGIVGTFSTLADWGNNNVKLAPLFGLDGSVPGAVPASQNFNGTFNITSWKGEELFRSLASIHISGMKHTIYGLAPDAANPPYISLNSTDGKALISAYRNLTLNYSGVYFSYPVDVLSYGGLHNCPGDRQLFYDAIVWSKLESRENVIPSVDLLQPSGGEKLRGGDKFIIKWSASDLNIADDPINISYSLNSGSPPWTNIAIRIPNSGSYQWSVPLLDSQSVRIRVSAYDNNSQTGYSLSATDFSIDSTAPAASILSPGAGNVWGAGLHNIAWTASDNFPLPMKSINLSYTLDNGVTWKSIVSGADNTPPYGWNIPSSTMSSKSCMVNLTVTDVTGLKKTVHSGLFTIDTVPPVASAKVSPSNRVSPLVRVTFDASGSTDNLGNLNYTWSFDENGTTVNLYEKFANYTFTNFGTYLVVLTVNDGANADTDSKLMNVTDTAPPRADAGRDATINQGTDYHFDGSNSSDDVKWGLQFVWTFTDIIPVTLHGMYPSYRFDNDGVFSVSLAVTDIAKNTDSDTVIIKVIDTSSPRVMSVYPPDGMKGVDVHSKIQIKFSKPMSSGSFTQAAFQLEPKVPFNWTAEWDSDGTNVAISFVEAGNSSSNVTLQDATPFKATVSSAVSDTSGNHIAAYSWQFETGDITPPRIMHTPVTSATEDASLAISAEVTDNVLVASVRLHYRTEKTGWKVLLMTTPSGKPVYVYEATIHSAKEGHINYYIDANDTSGNIARSPESGYHVIKVSPQVPLWVYLLTAVLLVAVSGIIVVVATRRRKHEHRVKSVPVHHDDIVPIYVESARNRPFVIVETEEEEPEVIKPREEITPDSPPPPPPPPSRTIFEPELEETIKKWAKKRPKIDVVEVEDRKMSRAADARWNAEIQSQSTDVKEDKDRPVDEKGSAQSGGKGESSEAGQAQTASSGTEAGDKKSRDEPKEEKKSDGESGSSA